MMILAKTPLRISFFGGGTDIAGYYRYNGGGAVLSTTIDKYFYVFVKERFDDLLRVSYSRLETVDHYENLQHELVRESLKKTDIRKGIEIATISDIPSKGCGLGSSSTVSVGLLNALYHHRGITLPPSELAKQACDIEINILGKPIGKQDQYAAAFGNMNVIRFLSNEVVEVVSLDINSDLKNELNSNLLLFWTGITRKAEMILEEQVENIPQKIASLNTMKDMVAEGQGLLKSGNLNEFGKLLHTAWELKKKQASKITNDTVNDIYSKALAAGAFGGKITGAGGGGFLLLYCPADKQANLRRALSDLRELPFKFEEEGTKILLT